MSSGQCIKPRVTKGLLMDMPHASFELLMYVHSNKYISSLYKTRDSSINVSTYMEENSLRMNPWAFTKELWGASCP